MLQRFLKKLREVRGSTRGDVGQINGSDGNQSIAINGATTVYSQSFPLHYGQYFGLAYKAAGSAPDLKIQLEQSPVAPSTEGASDANYVIPSGVADITSSVTATTMNIQSISPVPMRYGRLKITGNVGNGANTTLRNWLFQQGTVS